MGASHTNCTSGRSLHWTACLHCVPATWVSPQSSWNCISTNNNWETLTIQPELCSYIPTSIFTHQSEQLYSYQSGQSFWTNKNVKIWSPHWHEDDPIRGQGWGTSFCTNQLPSGWGVHFFFSLKTISTAGVEILEIKHQRHLEGAEWNRSEQSCLSWEGPHPRATS